MALHVHGYQKMVKGKLITVGDYDADRAAAAAQEAKDNPERPPMVATQGKFGHPPMGQMPLGRDVPGVFPKPPPVIHPLKVMHAAAAHAAIAAGKPTDPKTGHALPDLKNGQSLHVSAHSPKKWAVVEAGAVHHLIDKDTGQHEPVPKSWHQSHAKGNLKEIAHVTEAGHVQSPGAAKLAAKAEQGAKAGSPEAAHELGQGGHPDHATPGKGGGPQAGSQPQQAVKPADLPVLTGDAIHAQPGMTPSLSTAEKNAVESYTGHDYIGINRRLREDRHGKPNPLGPGPLGHATDNLAAAIAKSKTDSPILVHRGIAYAPWLSDNLDPGTVITDKGFVSTTTDFAMANNDFAAGVGGIRFDISVPAGHPALSVKDTSGLSSEAEVILPHGSSFQVTSDKDENGVRVVKMAALPIGKSAPDGVPSTLNENHTSTTPPALKKVEGMSEVLGAPKGHKLAVKHLNGTSQTLRKSNNGPNSPFHDKAGQEVGTAQLNEHRKAGRLFHGDASEDEQPFAKPAAKSVPEEKPLTDVSAHQESMSPKASPAEQKALDEYTSNAYSQWNQALRGGYKPVDVSPQIKDLDSLIAKAKTSAPILVHRGVRTDQTDSKGNVTKASWLPQMAPGTTIADSAFLSTTTDLKMAGMFSESGSDEGTDAGTRFDIHVPKGASALSVARTQPAESSNAWEQEVLLPRDSKFEVVSDSKDQKTGQRVVSVKLVTDAQGGLHENAPVKASAWRSGVVSLATAQSGAGKLWLNSAEAGIQHVLLVVKNNPLKELPEILTRPDIKDALFKAGQKGMLAVQGAIAEVWSENGGPDGSPYLQALLDDAARNGNTFANRMAAALATTGHDEVRNVLERDRLRAAAGESVAATRGRVAGQLLSMAADGITQVRWVTRSSNPCSACLALEAGPPITLGEQFDPLAGGLNLPVYHDLAGPPRHPGCECELVAG